VIWEFSGGMGIEQDQERETLQVGISRGVWDWEARD
jgi:type IV pilus assembly protein PilQ